MKTKEIKLRELTEELKTKELSSIRHSQICYEISCLKSGKLEKPKGSPWYFNEESRKSLNEVEMILKSVNGVNQAKQNIKEK